MDKHVIVLGAGIVGVCCALELLRRGVQVTLVDRQAPGMETSLGNAGVLARSSLMPFNHPGLWGQLPRLMKNDSVQFRYRASYLARNLGWATRYLLNARPSVFKETVNALDGLIRLSAPEHLKLLLDAGARSDPLVRGLNHLGEIGISQNALRVRVSGTQNSSALVCH